MAPLANIWHLCLNFNFNMKTLISILRILAVSIIMCALLYAGGIFALAQLSMPYTANGSLIKSENGKIIGSALIAQKFTFERYFWPRPSAVDYDAAASGGSNLAPTSAALAKRAQATLTMLKASAVRTVPADLIASSASGLDPDISIEAARYQIARVAAARKIETSRLERLIEKVANEDAFIFCGANAVNVLKLNMELDSLGVLDSKNRE